MGSANHFKDEEITKYKVFVESGTFNGGGTNHLASRCERGYTIDVYPLVSFKQNNVKYLIGDTVDLLEDICVNEKENIVFWLDAHYPHFYGANPERFTTLPLIKELEIIARTRSDKQDLILMDDLRIYVNAGYQSGGLPGDIEKGEENFMDIVKSLFPNRELRVDLADEGYLSILPNADNK